MKYRMAFSLSLLAIGMFAQEVNAQYCCGSQTTLAPKISAVPTEPQLIYNSQTQLRCEVACSEPFGSPDFCRRCLCAWCCESRYPNNRILQQICKSQCGNDLIYSFCDDYAKIRQVYPYDGYGHGFQSYGSGRYLQHLCSSCCQRTHPLNAIAQAQCREDCLNDNHFCSLAGHVSTKRGFFGLRRLRFR